MGDPVWSALYLGLGVLAFLLLRWQKKAETIDDLIPCLVLWPIILLIMVVSFIDHKVE